MSYWRGEMTELIRTIEPLRAKLALAREKDLRVGLVPTMGALHRGHVALMEEARRRVGVSGVVVVTVFVNPTQFGPNEDFTKYPRMLEKDVEACRAVGADYVFSPGDPTVIYPPGDETRVRVTDTGKHLEGAFRPHHFEGVATVCSKLFQIVGPSIAIFGRKDYQQLQIIKRVVADLFMPIEIVGLATIREPDGLALSSRNAYLSEGDRARARAIPEGLSAAVALYARGERSAALLAAAARAPIEKVATSIDYVACADATSMTPVEGDLTAPTVLAVAVRVGTTRLIDNVVLGEDPAPIC